MKIINFAYICLTFACILLFIPGSAQCELKALDDTEMSGVYAEGFSNFTVTNNPVTGYDETMAWFNIHTSEYTTIDDFKLGYHDQYDYKDPNPGFGWDEDWTNVTFGANFEDPSTDLVMEGLYFKAEFDQINVPANRVLKSITFGADYIHGVISADYNSFSGTIDDSDNSTPEYNGHRLNLGTKTITTDWDNNAATNSKFSLSMSLDGFKEGYWVTFSNATVTP